MKIKHLLYSIILLIVMAGCSSEYEPFKVVAPDNAFTFTPAMGGAVLQYKLPDDADIVAINVRYKDAYGNLILKSGSNSTDQLSITGFNEAVSDIPVSITYVNRNNEESQPFEASFSTEDSAPICFINSAEVNSGWNGCSLKFSNPEGTTGMAHVFYLGIDPLSNQPDTILIESFPLVEGEYTNYYTPEQKQSSYTIIVKVEDYRGYMVKERSWENIQAFNVEKLDPENFDIIYNNSLEVPAEKIGIQYLTDGDTKGTSWFEDSNNYMYHTFISLENGAGPDSEPMYIDLHKRRATSEVRFYAYRYIGSGKPNLSNTSYIGPTYIKQYWMNMLPCSVTIYGCRDDVNASDLKSLNWEEIGSFDEDPDADSSSRWTYTAATCGGTTLGRNTFSTLAKMEAASPIYKSISIPIELQGDGFRYLMIKFNGVFNMTPASYEKASITNKTTRYLSFHELEVYTDIN